MILRLSEAAVKRGRTTVLGPMTEEFALDGITAVLGHNGAGKSLLLKLIHGVIPASRGRVTWDRVPAAKSRAERGFVFQKTPVLRRSVLGNVGIVGGDAMAALDQVGLHDKAKQPAATLSGGEQQRMALARALVGGPKVLILDEPTASLDRAATSDFERILGEVRDRQIPVLMATHDLKQAERCADHVILMADGNIVANTTSDSFFGSAAHPEAVRFLNGH